MNICRTGRPAKLGPFLALLALLLCPVKAPAQGLGLTDDDADDGLIDDFAEELGVDTKAGTPFRLVHADAPDKGIGDTVYWRRVPGYVAAETFPVKVEVGGVTVIGPIQEILPDDVGMATVYRPSGRGELLAGASNLFPGNIPVRVENGRVKADHPAILVTPDEVRIRCARVTLRALDADGRPTPHAIQLSDGKVDILRESARFNPLRVWLPVGVRYMSTLGTFDLTAEGMVKPVKLADNVTPEADGLLLTVPSKPEPAGAVTGDARPYLMTQRGRRVFAQTETPTFFVLVPPQFPGAQATIEIDGKSSGHLALPAGPAERWDSRAFTVEIADLTPGNHTVQARLADIDSTPLTIEVVRWQRRSPFLIHTMSCCTAQWPTTPEGLDILEAAGIEMVTATGHYSVLNTQMPTLGPVDEPGLPPEAGLKRTANDQLLEELLRHRLRLIDLTVARGANFYNEGLSYHHSYAPSVERMVRRMAIFTQQTADYPSFWGVNLGWFPKLGGYVEGGVATDAHTVDRNAALAARLADAGLSRPSREEVAWYQENKFAEDPAIRARVMAIQERRIAYWRAQQSFGFGEHNSLYASTVRQIAPDVQTVLYDNAGHDADNRARSQWNDLAAVCYESYTDYGEWPMSAAFSTDWARGTSPDQPVWLTVDWGTSSEGMMKSLFHALARGLQGGGCPMQGDTDLKELDRRGRGLQLLQQYGTLARTLRPDNRVAIVATLSQRRFDPRGSYYAYHAMYYHLTRLGYPPVIVDEEDLVANGIPEEVQVAVLVHQEHPLNAATLRQLDRFKARGGKLLVTGDSLVSLEGAQTVGKKVVDIWQLSGFHPESHRDMWNEFEENWRQPLAEAMAETGIVPLAQTDPDRAIALTFDVGALRYLVVLADRRGTHAREFVPTPELPISVAGTGWQVRDLTLQKDVPAHRAENRTDFALDLITEPVRLLVMWQARPDTIVVRQSGSHFKAQVLSADNQDLGAVPLTFTFVAPTGPTRDVLFRAAGDTVTFTTPALDDPGAWTVRVQELLSGRTATRTWQPSRAAAETIKPVTDVQIVDARRLREFAAVTGRKTVIVEPGQNNVLAEARILVEKLREAGVDVRLWHVQPEAFDSIPVRWYPRPEDRERLEAVKDGDLIGYRQDLEPYVDSRQRIHVPKRGGYATIDPPWMVGDHAIVFSGGKLAESLRSVTTWIPTPSVPGVGQGRLLACFSPFTAGHHVAVIGAHDAEGRRKAIDQLVTFFHQDDGEPASAKPDNWQVLNGQTKAGSFVTPFSGFAPFRRVNNLVALADGSVVVDLKGSQDTLAVIKPDGKIATTLATVATELTAAEDGHFWVYHGLDDQTIEGLCLSTDGSLVKRFVGSRGTPGGMQPPNRSVEASFPVAPDGKAIAFGGFGGLWIGNLQNPSWTYYDDLNHVVRRYEVWAPRFPVGMTFSPDGQYIFFTMDTRPTGFTNMSQYAFTPTGNEAVLLDTATGKRVWTKRWTDADNPAFTGSFYGNRIDSLAFVTHSGFAAVARNGELTALADFAGRALLIDKQGTIVLEHTVYDHKHEDLRDRSYAWGPRGGIGVWMSPGGELAAFVYRDKIVLAHGNQAVDVALSEAVDADVARDGSIAVVALENGTVVALAADGSERWRFDCEGISPQVATLPNGDLVVVNHRGTCFRLSHDGQPVWKAEAGEAVDRGKHPLTGGGSTKTIPGPIHYREPKTLDIAKTYLGASKLQAWELAGPAATRFGRDFYAAAKAPIKLSAPPDTANAFIHLVYRLGDNNATLTVLTRGAGHPETFTLDLPTPEYRIVDIPVQGPDIAVDVQFSGAVEIAECSLWGYTWPGPNIAFVKAAGAETGTGLLAADTDSDLGDLGMDLQLDEAGTNEAGSLKDARIFQWNSDPDRVQGDYLRPGINPLKVVDGKRFSQEKLNPWSTKDIIGPWFTLDFKYPASVGLVATYDRVTRQSQVASYLAVFEEFDPDYNRDSGRVLAAAIDNDQFWRLFVPRQNSLKRLGIHVRASSGLHGLSEVEAYQSQRSGKPEP